MPGKFYTYWTGPMPDYIRFCLDTMKKHLGNDLVIVTKDNEHEYTAGIIDNAYRLIDVPSQRSDIVRLAILYKHGGYWIDADTVMLRRPVVEIPAGKELALMRWPGGKLINGYIVAKKDSAFLKKCIDQCNEIVSVEKKKVYRAHSGVLFGEIMLQRAHPTLADCVHEIPLETFIPIEFVSSRSTIWFSNNEIGDYTTEKSFAIALNNSQYGDNIKKESVENLLADDNLFGQILRLADMCMSRNYLEIIPGLKRTPRFMKPTTKRIGFSYPGTYCGVIFYQDGNRMLGPCLKRLQDCGLRIIAVDGAYKEFLRASGWDNASSTDGCMEVARSRAEIIIPAKPGGWDDEVEKRNAYLKAVPVGSYFMWIDADELLPEGLRLGKLTADFYQVPEILHCEDGTTKRNMRLRVAKRYEDLVYRYQHCRMYRMSQHVEGELASGCVVRSSGSTNAKYPVLLDVDGNEVCFDHYPFKRSKERQEAKERWCKIRKESKFPY